MGDLLFVIFPIILFFKKKLLCEYITFPFKKVRRANS